MKTVVAWLSSIKEKCSYTVSREGFQNMIEIFESNNECHHEDVIHLSD